MTTKIKENKNEREILSEILEILPATGEYEDYNTWIGVCTTCKNFGVPQHLVEAWSAKSSKFDAKDFDKKWKQLPKGSNGIGWLVKRAKEYGYSLQAPVKVKRNNPLLFDYDKAKANAITLLNIMFAEDELTSINPSKFDSEKNRHIPVVNGVRSLHISEVIENIDDMFKDTAEGGVFWRLNPLDGQGEKDSNVTQYKYALLESDEHNIPEQMIKIKQLAIPYVAIVHSGNKSLHCIIPIMATNKEEYDSRVKYLYDYCLENDFKIDPANKNASRLSRFPFSKRGKKHQFIVKMGDSQYNTYEDWVEYTVEQKEIASKTLRNYREVNGNKEKVLIPKMVERINVLSPTPLCNLRGQLVYFNKGSEPVHISKSSQLQGWLKERMELDWCQSRNLFGKDEFYGNIVNELPYHSAYTEYPVIAPRGEPIIQRFTELPKATPDYKYLKDFIAFFCPASDVDRKAITMLFASAMFRLHSARPIFLIRGESGKGNGKTMLAEFFFKLYGNTYKEITPNLINSVETFNKELLSTSANFLRGDNWNNKIGGSGLANFATAPFIEARRLYGEMAETIPNRFTMVITTNNGTVTEDCSDRIYPILLAKPTLNSNWQSQVSQYIKEYRWNIISELWQLLHAKPKEYPIQGRFHEFDKYITTKIFTEEQYNEYYKSIEMFRDEESSEREAVEQLYEFFHNDCQYAGTVKIAKNCHKTLIEHVTGIRSPHTLKNLITMNLLKGKESNFYLGEKQYRCWKIALPDKNPEIEIKYTASNESRTGFESENNYFEKEGQEFPVLSKKNEKLAAMFA
jgi:Primase C terminal 2 (PriCT-2)